MLSSKSVLNRGKKAKRKAREKQLEDARRLATLQKKRELKAAGIEVRTMKRASKGINYNNEVAFEKRPALGFYDVGEEQQLTKEMGQEFRPVTLEEMEGKRRKVRSNLLASYFRGPEQCIMNDSTLKGYQILKRSTVLDSWQSNFQIMPHLTIQV